MDGKRERVATRQIGGPRDYDWEEEEKGWKGREWQHVREVGQGIMTGKRKRRAGKGESGNTSERWAKGL